jgi:hypothetical protein
VETNKVALVVALWLTVLAVTAPDSANADTVVTYNFSGYVEYADGSLFTNAGITGGITVTGTYTFDLTNPSATLQGSVGSTAAWELLANGTSAVFSTKTLQVGGISYASASPANGAATSYVSGGPYNSTGQYLNASESNSLATLHGVQGLSSFLSFYSCYNGCGGTLPLGEPAYLATGLPVSLNNDSQNYLSSNVYGGINFGGNTDYMVYQITDLEPAGSTTVPLPSAAWLMLSGLAALGALAQKKRVRAAFE